MGQKTSPTVNSLAHLVLSSTQRFKALNKMLQGNLQKKTPLGEDVTLKVSQTLGHQ